MSDEFPLYQQRSITKSRVLNTINIESKESTKKNIDFNQTTYDDLQPYLLKLKPIPSPIEKKSDIPNPTINDIRTKPITKTQNSIVVSNTSKSEDKTQSIPSEKVTNELLLKTTDKMLQKQTKEELIEICMKLQDLIKLKTDLQDEIEIFERKAEAFYNEFFLFFKTTIKDQYPDVKIDPAPRPTSFYDQNDLKDLIDYVKHVFTILPNRSSIS